MSNALESVGNLVNTVLGTKPPELPKAKVAPVPGMRKRAGEKTAQRKYGTAGRIGTLLSEGDKLG